MRRALAWWRRAGPAWCYALPLALLAALVGADWLRLHAEGVASRAEAQRLLTRVGIVAWLAAIVMGSGARRWRAQGLGLLAFLVGAGGLCARVLGRFGPQPVAEWERDAYQACLEVGGYLLVLGLVLWVLSRWVRHRGSEAPTEEMAMPAEPKQWNGKDRRNGPEDRRGPQA